MKKIILILVIALAAVLRLWNLGGNPPGLTWDEASLGYNGYSILQTGRDEYGTLLPFNLKSFGDWKPALYAYLTVPFIGIFGLNEWVVRLPSALFGVATVILIYLFVFEFFKNKWLAYLSSFFLAISPWHLQFSRPAFEANIALFFNLLGAYLFIKKKFVPAALIFGISIFTYQGSRLFVPLLIIILTLIYRKFRIGGAMILFIIVLISSSFLFGQTSRLSTQNFFAYQRSQEEIQQISNEDQLPVSSFQFQVLHGEWFTYARGLVERFMIYFSPKMLFIEGDYSERHSVPDLGPLYFFSLILIPLGIFYLWKSNSSAKLIFLWLIIAPLPAVLSRDLVSILRAFNMVIPWVIFEAAGFYFLIRHFKKVAIVFFLLIIFNFLIFMDRYFIHAPQENAKFWLYGYKQIYQKWADKFSNYDKIVITDTFGQPYIYYLFYTKYPPKDFQKQAILDQPGVDVGNIRKIDNIEFRHIYWPVDRGSEKALFIGPEEELPEKDIESFKEFATLEHIKFSNKESAFKVVETK